VTIRPAKHQKEKTTMSKTFDKQTAKFLAVLTENVPALSGDEMQGWIQNPRALQKLLSELSSSTAISSISLSEMDGVWMSSNAKLLFNGNLGAVCKTETSNLEKAMNDFEIMDEHGDDIVFDSVDDLEATIADLIAKQPNGKKGKLLNDGCANIFYVRVSGSVSFVRVYWCSGVSGWRVRSDRVNGTRWRAGGRVFRNCGRSDA